MLFSNRTMEKKPDSKGKKHQLFTPEEHAVILSFVHSFFHSFIHSFGDSSKVNQSWPRPNSFILHLRWSLFVDWLTLFIYSNSSKRTPPPSYILYLVDSPSLH